MGCSNTLDCTGWPFDCPPPEADPDIAGPGVRIVIMRPVSYSANRLQVMLGFWVSALVALIAAIILHIVRRLHKKTVTSTSPPPSPVIKTRSSRLISALEQFVLGLGDQQLILAIVLACTTFSKSCFISMYHLELVGEMMCFSVLTHLASLIVLRPYFDNNIHHRFVLRSRMSLSGILFLFMLSFVIWIGYLGTGIYGKNWGRGSEGCPAHCAFKKPIPVWHFLSPSTFNGLAGIDRFYAVLALVEPPILITCFTLGIFPYTSKRIRQRWVVGGCAQHLSLLILVLVWIVSSFVLFHDRLHGTKVQGFEDAFGFGQVEALVLLLMVLWSAITTFSEVQP
jgi:hypothetical protein